MVIVAASREKVLLVLDRARLVDTNLCRRLQTAKRLWRIYSALYEHCMFRQGYGLLTRMLTNAAQ